MRAVILLGLLGCASAKPWRPTGTLATIFEGKPLETAIGFEVETRCEKKGSPSIWGDCISYTSSRRYSMRITWSDDRLADFDLGVTPGPPPRTISARRMTDRVIAVQLTTNDPATFDTWQFFVERYLRNDYIDVGSTVHLRGAFTMTQARDQAIREQWPARDLVKLFGRVTEIDAYAVEQHDFDYLRICWLALRPDLQHRALANAIDKRDPQFVMEHWRYLDATLLEAAVELMIRVDQHYVLANDNWWRTLPVRLQQRVVAAVRAAPASDRRTWFFERRGLK